jgi:hypothetical protein
MHGPAQPLLFWGLIVVASSGERKSWRLQITLEGKRRLPISSPIRLPPDKHASTCRARVDPDRVRHAFVPIRKIFSVL